ncbi:MarR family transcriptional regulator [Carnobacterium divergens]|uniref:DUF488 domain-containing protein n=1 Tax=Carnobacterium divergens TaxID=2748 RepID=UPI001071D0F1|nr:DUF488 family protein [Carnobacterium divergens]MDT1997094.1 DUF488 family protein [Carnobacterium divergens]TFI66376.1 MarR family transcriptional regulator [Carnobacterium divergens]TFI66419.1 MarR family transcriptional regulator [Carnobacterium divergens]TFI69813.1 MarR family transcriptional regulator [Carnobacterium divergens]TFI81480.1 MarR family transcriptional regulator [Carnobacterium divergens]
MITMKRIYLDYQETDGERILVDRLWPRGVSKEQAYLTEWAKEIAPSTELRKWYHQHLDQFEAFSQAYQKELLTNPKAVEKLVELTNKSQKETLTFVYGAKNQLENHVVVLLNVLKQNFKANVQKS